MRGPVAALLASIAALGCNDPGVDLNDPSLKPEAAKGACGAPYPEGPYELAVGGVFPCDRFDGFANAKADSSALQKISLTDFYNPHADDASYHPASDAEDDRLYPPGSPYGAGKKKPTGLLVDIASVWCGPCNQEAKSEFPALHARVSPCGGEILFQLVESSNPGSPATEQNLRNWTKAYKVDYPATLDPLRQLQALYSSGVFPATAVVDTRTMRITAAVQGVPDDSFFAAFDAQLDAACLAQQTE